MSDTEDELRAEVERLRRRVEALDVAERNLQLAVEAAGVGLWHLDLVTGVAVWNDAMRRITGHDTPVAFARYVDLLVHPEDRPRMRESVRVIRDGGRIDARPHRIVRPDGSVRWVVALGEVEHDADGVVARMRGCHVDVTAQQEAGERARRAERLEALATLAAGIAHDFNNVLMVVAPNLELLRDVVPASHVDLVDDALEASTRAAGLLRRLVDFSSTRPGPPGDVPHDAG